jgi:hypothetical protein
MPDFRPADGVKWAVELRGVLLVDGSGVRSRFLEYPEAAAWDFLSRRDPRDRIVEKLGATAGLSGDQAASLLDYLTGELCTEGFLERELPSG